MTAVVLTDIADLDLALDRATAAARALRTISDTERAGYLDTVAEALDAAVDELVPIAQRETHLPEARLTSEVARTTGQLRLLAAAVREGSYLEAIIDHAAPAAAPPRPDLRRVLIPLGPVVNFAASNFPFAFSVAGGDTAAALAAGCPVIVKAHSGHRDLSRRTADIVANALAAAGAPDGIFALAEGREVATALVAHPGVKAGSFTGSVAGGRALFDIAVRRPDPIPFYGELGSVNPVVVTAAADAARASEIATGLAASFALGAGQFCTKPGLVFVPEGSVIAEHARAALEGSAPARLLTDGIGQAFADGWSALASTAGIEVLTAATSESEGVTPGLARVTLDTFRSTPALHEELFGPVTLLIEYADPAVLIAALAELGGSLTATLHAEGGEDVTALVEVLSERAGRVLFGGWPTGVAVTWSQNHGGPWPATTSLFTSVGVTGIRRFQRPVAYQDAPEALLPPALREENPLGIPRRVDGALEQGAGR